MKNITVCFCLCLLFAGIVCFGAEAPWPKMREFETAFNVDATAESIQFLRPLYDEAGVVRYVFVCRGGSAEYLSKLSEYAHITYVPPLGCRLSEGSNEAEYSLLAESSVPPWHTRGQIDYDDLVGDCAHYPEYGRIRHFRLRGFELALSAVDIVLNNQGRVERFKLKIALKKDARIQSRTAGPSGYLNPHQEGRGCKKIVKGTKQLPK